MRLKNKTFVILTLLVAISLVPSLALATTMEYYCYGSFGPVVSAFKLIATIFGNNSYQSLFYTVIISAAVFTGLAVYTKIASGGQTSILGWSVPMAIGIVMYIAFFVPKGSLQVYDEVMNKTELVTQVPEGVVLVAGTFNLIERGLIEIVSTSGSIGSYQTQAGGKGFLGLYALTTRPLSSKTNIYLEQNLNYYLKDCVTFAVNNPASNLTIDELRRTPASFSTSLVKAANPAIYTLYLSPTDSQGDSLNCTDAWTAIVADMTPAELSGNMETVCTELGYDVSDAAQFNQCKQAVTDAKDTVGLSALTLDEFVKQVFIKNRLDSSYQSGNTQVVSNYQFLTNVSGSMKSFNEYYPVLRGVLTAVAIALIPILIIFLPTPMSGKIASILFGFFIWLTAWGVVDAILHGFAMEYANSVFSQVRNEGLGLDALYFFPNASVKALAMFGTLRMSGLVLSTALTGMLVKFGGNAITQMGSSLQGHIAAAGGIGASRTEDIVGQSQAVTGLSAAGAPTAAWASSPMAIREEGAYGNMVGSTSNGLKSSGGVFESGGIPNYYGLQTGMGQMETSGNMGAVGNWETGMQIGRQMGMQNSALRGIQSMFKMNPGAFNTTMQGLQAQAAQNGWSGDQAADAFFAGKTIDGMKGNSIGNVGGFNMAQVVTGNDVTTTGEKGSMRMTWGSNGNLQAVTGFNQSFDLSAAEEQGYTSRIADSRAETASHLQSAGSNIMDALSNTSTRSALSSLAQRSSTVKSGMHETAKAIGTAISQNVDKAHAIKDSHGNTIEKGSRAWSQVVAKAQAALEFLGSGGGVTGSMGSEKSVSVKTSDNQVYTMTFGDNESRQIAQKAGETWKDSTSSARSTDKSVENQRSVGEAHAVTNTKSALDQVSASEQRTKTLEEARTSSVRMSGASKTSMDAGFVSWLGNKFGGGIEGDVKAANHIQNLSSAGTQDSIGQLSQLQNQFIGERGLRLSGEGLPAVAGPTATMPSRESVQGTIAGATASLNHTQHAMPRPAGPPANLRQQIMSANPHQGVSVPNVTGYQRYMDTVKGNMGTAGSEMEKINQSPVAPDLVFWGQVASPNAKDTSRGYVYENIMPSEFFKGRDSSKPTAADAGTVSPSKGFSVQKRRR
ncbi:conjugal transfer protein TraG N-terminal domain-containing protein [Pelobacter propionicus]|uniref:TraG N-terminal Proteobacteria domain-containing protein n=1 Tax=Pelobacter propionicus (strain DSM 2379 / NBRC 103807 / OttBd1) TaxID=338966 RepID=A0R7P8_PELPD|nr:conjugal transfer protein TraG N-terminal domain-containing protein [Pelobacter propionicus]ABL01356.1 hypothetical protein Ppro_3767 [Pelobacter propionicus DSM 2379]